MTWFRVDDGFWSHPKVIECPDSAIGLWARAGAYSAQHLTDGIITKAAASVLRAKKRDICALTAAGLWQECDGGWRFHDWEDHQPLREQVRDRRTKTAQRVARWRAAHASDTPPPDDAGNGVTGGVTNGVSNAAPDPTRPDPYPKEEPSSSPTADAADDEQPPPPSKPDKNDRDDVRALCALMVELVVANGSKRPNITKAWRDDARLLIDKDGRDLGKALELMRWAANDTFWRSNVQCIPTFREKYDQLRLKALAQWEERRGGQPSLALVHGSSALDPAAAAARAEDMRRNPHKYR